MSDTTLRNPNLIVGDPESFRRAQARSRARLGQALAGDDGFQPLRAPFGGDDEPEPELEPEPEPLASRAAGPSPAELVGMLVAVAGGRLDQLERRGTGELAIIAIAGGRYRVAIDELTRDR